MEYTDKIAIFTDNEGCPSDFYSAVSLSVFEFENSWIKSKAFSLTPVSAVSVSQVRKAAYERHNLIEDCKIIVAKELSGIPFSVFDMAGYSIFAINEIADDILTGIIKDVFEADQSVIKAEMIKNAVPIEVGESGYYFMDLVELQKHSPEVSSKMALSKFLEETPFMELKLRCAHIPPWIEKSGAYEVSSNSDKGALSVIIRKKMCRD